MPHWPGDPEVAVKRSLDMNRGDACNLTTLSASAHTGTHVDAPLHFLRDGASMDSMPLDALIGPARVIGIEDSVAIGVEELKAAGLRHGDRVLFRTRNSDRRLLSGPFVDDFVYLSASGARYLVETGVRAVGIDYLSIGGLHHDLIETHVELLKAGIWIIEGLDLTATAPGDYEMICLPLRIAGAEGAPARAILRPLA
jgi:arylformamidase